MREKYKISDDTFVIGYFGTLNKYDCINNVLSVLKLVKKNLKIKLVVIGDGPYKNEMLKLIESLNIENNVLYLGKMNHDSTLNHYRIIDAVIISRDNSEYSQLVNNVKVYESLSMNKLVIMTNNDIYKGVDGLLTYDSTVEDLVGKLTLFATDSNYFNEMKKKSHTWYNNNYSTILSKGMSSLINLYNKSVEII